MKKIVETLKKYRRRRKIRFIVETVLKTNPEIFTDSSVYHGDCSLSSLFHVYLNLCLDLPLPEE
jgi:hypothetical protein